MADGIGEADLRKEYVTPVVTGFALQSYVMKQLCTTQKSSAWKETYFVETAADLTGGAHSSIKDVSRGAVFPHGRVTWTENSKRNVKHAFEGQVYYEDRMTNNINVISRTLERIGRAVAKSVDTEIWETLVEAVASVPTATNINSVTIATGSEWDSTNLAQQNPIQDILDALTEIKKDNYNPYSQGYLLLNPTDFGNLMGNANIRNSGQFYTSDVTKNGRVGRIASLTILESLTVTDDYAAVVIKNEACTWQSVVGLTVRSVEEPGRYTMIKAWEIGVAQLKNPNAVCLISNTQAS